MFRIPLLASRVNWMLDTMPSENVTLLTAQDSYSDGRHITIKDQRVLHFGNVSYIGLDIDERLKNAACDAIMRYGVQYSMSRAFVKLPMYDELESLLSKMFGRPVIVTPTTTLAHQAAMPMFMHANDAILVDYQAHASLQTNVEIVRARGAMVEHLAHNDLNQLEERVKALTATHDRVWYVADGIYSMYGDMGPMPLITQLLNKYENLYVYLDDAHGMSWAGENGTGIVCEQMEIHERLLLVTSLNKGFASGGGVIICPDEQTKTTLKRCGSSLVFSGPLQPGALAAGVESAKIHLSPEIVLRQEKVKSNIRYFLECAKKYNIPLMDKSETPIFYVPIGNLPKGFNLCWKVREAGFYTNIGCFPAVPFNKTGLRISINYHLEKQDIDHLLRVLAELIEIEQSLIKNAPKEKAVLFNEETLL